MWDAYGSFLSTSFLRSEWAHEYETFKDSLEEHELLERLIRWSNRAEQTESTAQSAFLEEFFHSTWGYLQSGQAGAEARYTLYPEFPVPGAGQQGGVGHADAALGFFPADGADLIPQVLIEFKSIESALDAPQRRKGNSRSPVKQGLDYLFAARRGMFGNEPVLPMWAIVTDMNEFRLYWADRGERQHIGFTIRPTHLFQGPSLLGDDEGARFDRFLFVHLFRSDTLIVQGASGRPTLYSLIQRQRFQQHDLQNQFYDEYRSFREHLYRTLLSWNGPDTDAFPGTNGKLVRIAQKILDRLIFIFFCEDMGRVLSFPPQLFRNYLVERSNDEFFNPYGNELWQWLRRLFDAMNDGSPFGDNRLNSFNGGLFASDPDLDRLYIPNMIFCERGQGQNEASLATNKRTLLYLSAHYNYASGWSGGLTGDERTRAGERSIGLYTLGRIFEQSITELEILEAREDGRPSLNEISKRKRDGVYYTPEWVVQRIVQETVGRRLADMKSVCGWPSDSEDRLPTLDEITAYENQLRDIRILDPACGSGAFLITTLSFLLDEWRVVRELRRQRGQAMARDDWTDDQVRDILQRNLYGVDINSASVEISKLALWLHTARSDRPLSSLDDQIRVGNSLIGPNFFERTLAAYDEEERERINAFDWQHAFPNVFERGGFDCVVGNPPYVKLQNFRKYHPDMAAHLARAPEHGGEYRSTQTGNFDIYLAFIEKGLQLLNEDGRLGYIAPSVWSMNEYGAGLRSVIEDERHLWGWIDFGSYQIFEEATTYTALQFYSRRPNDRVAVVKAPDGVVAESPWEAEDITLSYDRLSFNDRWLLATGVERDLIDKLTRTGRRLDDRSLTRNIFVGIQTSADRIYHLKRLGPNRYEEKPPKGERRGRIIAIEDTIMKPLVSGVQAKRYLDPQTNTHLLFPYTAQDRYMELIPAAIMQTEYPLAWRYLMGHEVDLRARENHKMNTDDGWWAYNYPKNLDKQEFSKLLVAQTVRSMQVSADYTGNFYVNNVRVNAIIPAPRVPMGYLLSSLNGRVADFVFRRTAKPKDNLYFEANKQFISYLPIPAARDEDKFTLASSGEQLQRLHSNRRDALSDIVRRLSVVRVRRRPDNWLFPDLPSLDELIEQVPNRTVGIERRDWARERLARELGILHTNLEEYLTPGAVLSADLDRGELRFLINGIPAIAGIFLPPDVTPFVLAQWRVLAGRLEVTGKLTGKKLADELKRVSVNADAHLMAEVVEREEEISAIDAEIAVLEARVNETIYRLHGLTPEEIAIIEAASR